MPRVIRVFPRTPLAAGSVLLSLVVVAWLLAWRVDGVWYPGLLLVEPDPPAVATPPGPTASPDAPAPGRPAEVSLPRTPSDAQTRPRGPTERYVLESAPLTSPDAADRLEDRLSGLGYATIRFQKQDATRLYVVAATGFASVEEAEAAVGRLGRGAVVDAAGAAEVVLARLPSLADAVRTARPLRAQGFEVRVSEALRPTVTYHIRYGQFGTRIHAQAVSEELARNGIKSRVIKIRSEPR